MRPPDPPYSIVVEPRRPRFLRRLLLRLRAARWRAWLRRERRRLGLCEACGEDIHNPGAASFADWHRYGFRACREQYQTFGRKDNQSLPPPKRGHP